MLATPVLLPAPGRLPLAAPLVSAGLRPHGEAEEPELVLRGQRDAGLLVFDLP